MAKGKRQSGRKGRGDDSEDEEETEEKSKPSIDDRKKKTTAAAAGSASNAADQTSKPSRKEKRQQKQKQQAKHRGKGESSDDDGESGIAELLRGKRNDYAGSDDEDLPAPSSTTVKRPVNTNIQKKGTHTAMMALMQDSDDDDDGSESEQEEDIGSQQLSRKGKKKGAAFPPAKMANSKTDSDEEMDKPSLKGKKKKSPSAAKMVTFDSSDDEENAVVPQPSQGGNKKNAPPASGMAALKIESDTEDEDIDVNDDSEEVEQVAMVLADDDWAAVKKKSKKDRKEKKEKKEKKDKKEKKEKKEKKMQPKNIEETKEGKDADTAPTTAVVTQKKSKFELQMEAAMSKQKEAKVDEPEKDEGVKPPTKLLKELEPEPDWVDTVSHKTNDHSNDEVMYGAPDDKAWTDKSAAQIEQEETVDQGGDSTMYGPDGKKLSNKERKRLIKAKEAAEREAAFEKSAAAASRQGAQFACSQTAVNENDPQWENSLDINIPSFSISAAGKILFKDASLTVGHGRRYGLVAPNGRGKSTLLKMIASRDLKLPPRIDFLYVEQEVVADDTPAVEAVLRADTVRWDLMKEEASLMKAIDDGDEDLEKLDRLQAVIDELRAMGADAAEAKARRILYGLGFSMEMQTKPTRMFSGGWRMRISLARALFVEPTLLMLDEPTNHLDLNAVIWLDEYLQKWKKTLLVVSHDQDFLNSITQEILHIEDLKLCSYKGNYDSFKKAEHTKFLQQVKAWEKQEKRLKELKRSGQSRSKAEETLLKSTAKRESGGRNQKKKDQAVAAGTEAAENTELVKRPKEYQVKLEFVEVAELSRPVMEVSNVHFRYSPKHPIIFDKIDFGIDMDSRVCIVGPNGAGKVGELNPTTGEVKRNARLRMGIYNQHFVERLPMNKTAVEYLRDRFPEEDYQSIRNRLGKYGLEGHAHEVTMRDLSGGQKARVVFVDLSLSAPHILLLDEPTNNLDIETIDALCDAINQFNGGIVVVTHDQRLIEECEMTLWVVEKRGVTRWEAGFEDYKATILRELEEAIERENAARQEKLDAAAQAKAAKLANLSKKVKKK